MRDLMSRPVYIAGVGIHPFGRFEDTSVVDMGQAAVRMALQAADRTRGGFQAAYCGTVYSGVAAGHKVLTSLGLTGMPILNVEAGCASGGAALGLAAGAIAAGRYDCVLVFGMEKMPKGIIRSSFFEPWREQGGLAVTPAYFALRAQRLMRDSGVTAEHLAQVSVKNHRNGVHNPYAMFRKEFSVDAVLASPMVCDPLRLYMLCSPNEGAAAVVLSATPPAAGAPVRVAAATLRSHLPGNVLGEHTPLSGLTDDTIASPTELAAREAYESAGIGPQDLDVVELQDTDSARELLSYEELGLCPRGAAGEWIAEGRTEMSGALPVNPSGGLLSKGEPLGASGLGQVVELYWQLRGDAGPRQVAHATVALAHTVGRGANASVVILIR
jgi:acetyl-CoA acetyltransferase